MYQFEVMNNKFDYGGEDCALWIKIKQYGQV